MRLFPSFFASLSAILLTGCASLSALPGVPIADERSREPFIPRDMYPTPPNVGRLIGPEDCRGSRLAAVAADMPDYPARAYSGGRQGWVVVRFHVYSDGSVHRARIARSVPEGVFDRASRRAVDEWQFQPLEGVQILENCVVMFEFRAGEVRVR